MKVVEYDFYNKIGGSALQTSALSLELTSACWKRSDGSLLLDSLFFITILWKTL